MQKYKIQYIVNYATGPSVNVCAIVVRNDLRA